MKPRYDKAKVICDLYKAGHSMTQIAKLYGHDESVISNYVKRYYKEFFGENPLTYKEKKKIYLRDLYNKYIEIYVPYLYSRTKMCNLLNCSILDFESMLEEFKINHPRLQTYKYQRTLCNVPEEVYNEYQRFCKKKGWSMRKLATMAINNFILNDED